MLYFKPPFHLIEGLTLFPDHEDGNTFYYLPTKPHLSVHSGTKKPVFEFLKYVEDTPTGPKGGGYLSLQVDLGIADELKEKAKRKLADQVEHDNKKPLNLVPVQPSGGTVKLQIFGSNDDASTGPKVNQPATPALYGDNQAIFSVSLDEFDTQLLEQSLKMVTSPIGVIYVLEYTGLQPAYHVKVSADWTEVATAIGSSKGINLFLVSGEIKEMTQELVQKGVIDIVADTFVTGTQAKSTVDQKDLMLTKLTDMITSRFFEPVINPLDEANDKKAKGPIEGVVESLSELGNFNKGLFHFSKTKAKASKTLNLSAEVNERIAVARTVAPQAFLADFVTDARKNGEDLGKGGQYVKEIVLNDPFYKRRKVTVINRADLDRNSIASISVDLRYGSEKLPSFTLMKKAGGARAQEDPMDIREERSWPARKDSEGGMERDVGVSYTVTFKNDELAGQRPATLTHPEVICTGDVYEIVPYLDFFWVQPIKFAAAAGFPWERYSDIEIEVRYAEPEHGIGIEARAHLRSKDSNFDAASSRSTVRLFLMTPPAHGSFEYRVTYRGAGAVRDEIRTWETATATQTSIEIPNPFPSDRPLTVYAHGIDWTRTKRVFMDLYYEDKENAVDEQKASITFKDPSNGDSPEEQTVRFFLVDPARRDIRYDLTVQPASGSVVRIPGSITNQDRLFLDENLNGRRYVRPELAPGAMSRTYPKITVDLQRTDPDPSITNKPHTVEFTKDSDSSALWEYDFSTDSDPAYEYRIQFRDSRGKVKAKYPRSGNFEKSNAVKLTVPLSPPR